MRNKNIAFLTTDLLGDRSYSINYHLLLSIRNLQEVIGDGIVTIYTCNINSKAQRSLREVVIENSVDIPLANIDCKTIDYHNISDNGRLLSCYDVVFTEMYVWADSIEVAKAIKPQIKVVTWIHSLLREEYICNRHSKWVEYDLYVAMQEKLISISDKVIFDSYFDENIASRLYGCNGKSEVIYPVPDPIKLENIEFSPYDPNHIRLMFAGRWEYRKGIEMLIRAFFKCYTEGNMSLTILSDANFLANYKMMIVNPVILRMFECLIEKKAIVLLPWVNSREEYIRAIRKNADIMILPSMYDPFNIIAYDCIINCIPILISNYCGVTELLDDEMMIEKINPYNAMEIVEGVNKMKKKIGFAKIIDKSISYSPLNAQKDIVRLYKQLCNE